MGVEFTSSGSFDHLEKFLKAVQKLDIKTVVEPMAQRGVNALAAYTPYNSGLAARSWGYTISQNGSNVTITWTNSDVENGFPVAIALQYGYGTGTGGYVQGRDYINPALQPVFDSIAEEVWKVVTSA